VSRTTRADRRAATRLLIVLAGGLAGSAVRIAVGAVLGWEPGRWPVSTLVVNVVGAAAIGWYLARRDRSVAAWWSLDFWAIGVLGSLTTFSALSVETVALFDTGGIAAGALYAVVSSLAGVAAAVGGLSLGTRR
jgi:CrcB protein